MRILYFAWLRGKVGTAEENVALPPGVGDVGALLGWLQTQITQVFQARLAAGKPCEVGT